MYNEYTVIGGKDNKYPPRTTYLYVFSGNVIYLELSAKHNSTDQQK